MDQTEVRAWLRDLCLQEGNGKLRRCVTDAQRVAVIEDLLKNANKDKMSDDDRVVCREALDYLKERHGETQ